MTQYQMSLKQNDKRTRKHPLTLLNSIQQPTKSRFMASLQIIKAIFLIASGRVDTNPQGKSILTINHKATLHSRTLLLKHHLTVEMPLIIHFYQELGRMSKI